MGACHASVYASPVLPSAESRWPAGVSPGAHGQKPQSQLLSSSRRVSQCSRDGATKMETGALADTGCLHAPHLQSSRPAHVPFCVPLTCLLLPVPSPLPKVRPQHLPPGRFTSDHVTPLLRPLQWLRIACRSSARSTAWCPGGRRPPHARPLQAPLPAPLPAVPSFSARSAPPVHTEFPRLRVQGT